MSHLILGLRRFSVVTLQVERDIALGHTAHTSGTPSMDYHKLDSPDDSLPSYYNKSAVRPKSADVS